MHIHIHRIVLLAVVFIVITATASGQSNLVPVRRSLPKPNKTTEPVSLPVAPVPAAKVPTLTLPAPTNTMPSIGDLMTVIDKATANNSGGKDWSTPVKLMIIFTGLAILPSLLVMMTSFTRIVIVLAFVRRA